MLGLPVREFLRNPVSTAAHLASDPLQIWLTAQDEHAAVQEGKRPKCEYQFDREWEMKLHASLGFAWPCEEAAEFQRVWTGVNQELEARGIDPGPESFQWWNDGDAGLTRAIWCLVRHLKPEKVVETGVAHGVTSRCVLEALERNGRGRLWSIDLPPFEEQWRKQVGAAVGDRFAGRWTYVAGSSRRRLPGLLSSLGEIDLFIHDSLHSERNVRFELDRAWSALKPSGAIVADDIDANWGFHSFTHAFPASKSFVCESEPVRPDLRRFNQKGLFGIILKEAGSVN